MRLAAEKSKREAEEAAAKELIAQKAREVELAKQ